MTEEKTKRNVVGTEFFPCGRGGRKVEELEAKSQKVKWRQRETLKPDSRFDGRRCSSEADIIFLLLKLQFHTIIFGYFIYLRDIN